MHSTLVSPGTYLSSLSATAPTGCNPRWEPDVLVAPVRICGGGRREIAIPTPTGPVGPIIKGRVVITQRVPHPPTAGHTEIQLI
jgi:hypothetical protein